MVTRAKLLLSLIMFYSCWHPMYQHVDGRKPTYPYRRWLPSCWGQQEMSWSHGKAFNDGLFAFLRGMCGTADHFHELITTQTHTSPTLPLPLSEQHNCFTESLNCIDLRNYRHSTFLVWLQLFDMRSPDWVPLSSFSLQIISVLNEGKYTSYGLRVILGKRKTYKTLWYAQNYIGPFI